MRVPRHNRPSPSHTSPQSPPRRGQSYSENEDPGLAKYRERFFNFYDQRVMDGAWTSAKVWAQWCGCYVCLYTETASNCGGLLI